MVKSGLINNVKDLQAALFQPCRTTGTYLGSFLQNTLKTNQIEINTDNKTLKPIAKLKEPRDLFALSKELDCSQQAARWPSECQVLEGRIQHIEYTPPSPEQYYHPTGKEIQPKPVGEESGTIVFQYYPISAVNYFSRSCVGGSRYFLPACPNGTENNDDLKFESRFESGNLAKVVKITETYYELYLRTDLYTNRHMQWFYFRIQNTKKHIIYRFSFVNLSKGDSLYSVGMKPLLYSTKDAQLSAIGWRRCGDNITFYRNDNVSEDEDEAPNYTLSFNIEFPHDQDEVYLAHCYPYTYTDLQDYLNKLQHHPVKSNFTKLRLLCRSLAGNNVYYVTITEPPIAGEPKKKKAVVVTARVHPGETPSSWMMKGFIDFLTGSSNPAKELREKFIFKLVPMLNPDGVIVGNNRCSLTGRDLNRQYRTVIRETYPSVWHTKLMIRRLIEECGIAMYCDLHAHSRNHNIFIYGCENKRYVEKKLQEQVFPLMLHKNAADKFSFENCKFRIQRSKEGTGRVVVWMMGVANSYTMEASFAGSTLGSRVDTHFNVQDFESMGKAFCETLLDFCDEEPSKEKLRLKIKERLVKEGSNADEPTNIELSDYSSDEGDNSSSSENDFIEKKNNTIENEKESNHISPRNRPKYVANNSLPKNQNKSKQKNQMSPANIFKKTSNTDKTPQMHRKPLQVHKTILDPPGNMQTNDSSCFTSEPDSEEESGVLQKEIRKFKVNEGRKTIKRRRTPPQKTVTSTQPVNMPEAFDKVALKAFKQKNFSSKRKNFGSYFKTQEKHQPWNQKKYLETNNTSEKSIIDNTNIIQFKASNSLKQKIWTGCSHALNQKDLTLSKSTILNLTHWTKGPFLWATNMLPPQELNELKFPSKLNARQCVQKVLFLSKGSAEIMQKKKERIKKAQNFEIHKKSAKVLSQQTTTLLEDGKQLCVPARNDPISQVALLKLNEPNASKYKVSGETDNKSKSKNSKFKKNGYIMATITKRRSDNAESNTNRNVAEKQNYKKKKKRKSHALKKPKYNHLTMTDESTNKVNKKGSD